MTNKQKLELTWIGAENQPRLEGKALTAENTKNTENSDSLRSLRSLRLNDPGDLFENRLIFGDNLLALKALESQRNEKHRALFGAQNKVDQQREELIANIEGKLTQRADLKPLFTLRWRLQ